MCRLFEDKYQLIKVENRDISQNSLDDVSQTTRNASKDQPFRNTIIQNLQYYLNKELLTDLVELQKKLLLHKIEMVTHDAEGNRLPKNGIRFYYKEDNKIISYLSGRAIEKGFFINLEKRLKANEGKAIVDNVSLVSTIIPNTTVQEIGEKMFSLFDQCAASVLVTPKDIIDLLDKHNILPEFTFDNEGNLKELTILIEGERFKGDLTYKGIKLSAQLLAPYLSETFTDEKVIQCAIRATRHYIQCTDNELLSKQELIEVLNRNNIMYVERAEGSAALIINNLGKKLTIELSNYIGGYQQFLKDAGYDEINELSEKIAKKIQSPMFLIAPLNIHEAILYNAFLEGIDIQEISKTHVKIELTDSESKKLSILHPEKQIAGMMGNVNIDKALLVPTFTPNFSAQEIGEKMFSLFDQCAASVLVTPKDIINLLDKHNILPKFTFEKGNLTGLSIEIEGERYKGDLVYKGINLSAQLLAPYLSETFTDEKVIQCAIRATRHFIHCTDNKLLSKQELIEVLNRNNIMYVEKAEGPALIINHLGKMLTIELSNYTGGYQQFLMDAGYDGINELTGKIAEKIQSPVFIIAPLKINEAIVYNTLLEGNQIKIQEILKTHGKIELTDSESKKLSIVHPEIQISTKVVKAVSEKKSVAPCFKPSYLVQKVIGEKVFSVFDICAASVLVTQNDIIQLLEKHNIQPEFSVDKHGKLQGLSFIVEGKKYLASDFIFHGVKLSALLLAPYFTTETLTDDRIIQSAIKASRNFIQCTGDKLLSKQELIEVLNRNHMSLLEKEDGSVALNITQLGRDLSIDLQNYKGGYDQFLQDAGFNGFDELSKDLQNKIKVPALLANPLNIHEKFIYNTLLKGNLKEIQEISKLQTQISLTDGENGKMYKAIQTMNYYNATHNKMSRAASFLMYIDKSTGNKHSLYDIIKALNLRGVAVVPDYIEPQGPGERRQLKNVHFLPIDDKSGNPPLNFFQTITVFDSKSLKALFENLNPKDEELLSKEPIVEGVYFSFEPEVIELILSAETEPSIMASNKSDLLENYPELFEEVEYIESLEPTSRRGQATYPEYNSHSISSMFRDYGTMPINRGVDSEVFKKARSKNRRLS